MRLDTYTARGKLLLTGEYFVLDGATALAVPTKLGQRFTVKKPLEIAAETRWNVHYPDGAPSRSIHIYPEDWHPNTNYGRDAFKEDLMRLLAAIKALGVDSRALLKEKQIDCYLEFPANWGLGSSSTLISFAANFFGVDQYKLLATTFGGSGYDLACAGATGPLLYRRDNSTPAVTNLDWSPDWLKNTYFVHLNRKQNSREGMAAYRKVAVSTENIAAIDQITTAFTEPSLHLRTAAQLIDAHEELVSRVLGIERVRERFPDFPGTVKSLGAWGGDFMWALSGEPPEKVRAYFNERGYGTFIPYHDMVL